jgi:hypothetical protein
MAATSAHTIVVDRDLTAEERSLIVWLLDHGLAGANKYLPQVDQARVIGHCSCGCPSIDLAVGGIGPNRRAGMEIVSDYLWPTAASLFGIFLWATEYQLAGLEAWSLDGLATPTHWPLPAQLVAYEAYHT